MFARGGRWKRGTNRDPPRPSTPRCPRHSPRGPYHHGNEGAHIALVHDHMAQRLQQQLPLAVLPFPGGYKGEIQNVLPLGRPSQKVACRKGTPQPPGWGPQSLPGWPASPSTCVVQFSASAPEASVSETSMGCKGAGGDREWAGEAARRAEACSIRAKARLPGSGASRSRSERDSLLPGRVRGEGANCKAHLGPSERGGRQEGEAERQLPASSSWTRSSCARPRL